jgi:hypothetical protein
MHIRDGGEYANAIFIDEEGPGLLTKLPPGHVGGWGVIGPILLKNLGFLCSQLLGGAVFQEAVGAPEADDGVIVFDDLRGIGKPDGVCGAGQ